MARLQEELCAGERRARRKKMALALALAPAEMALALVILAIAQRLCYTRRTSYAFDLRFSQARMSGESRGQGCVAPGLVKEARCGPEPILRSLTSAPNAGNLHPIGERDPGQRSVPGYLRVVATALPSLRTGKLIPYPSRALLRNNFSNLSFVSVH